MSNQENIQNLFSKLEEIRLKETTSVGIPSLGKDYALRPLTAGHERMLMKSLLDSPIFNNKANNTLYTIIQDVLPDLTTEQIDGLTIFDKFFIIMELKKQSGNLLDITLEAVSTDDPPLEYKLDITKHLKKCYEIEAPNSKVVDIGGIEFTVSIPTIYREFIANRHIIELESRLDMEQSGSRTLLGTEMIVSTVVQFIESIKNGDHTINISELDTIVPIIDSVQRLSHSAYTQIFNAIDTVSKNYLKLKVVDVTRAKKKYSGVIEIENILLN